MLQVAVDDQLRTALAANLTIRCLLKTKYDRDSRHSKVAIAWAASRAEKLCTVMLEHIGQQTADFSIQLNMVELLSFRNKAHILFDLFLQECSENVRIETNQSFDRPVYIVSRRGKVHHVYRCNKRVEKMVAEEYQQVGEADKGPRPYFVDWLNPPVYDEGRRVDDPEKYFRLRSRGDMSLPEDDEDGPDETGGSQDVLDEDAAGVGPAIQAAVEGKIVGAGHADGADSPRDGKNG